MTDHIVVRVDQSLLEAYEASFGSAAILLPRHEPEVSFSILSHLDRGCAIPVDTAFKPD